MFCGKCGTNNEPGAGFCKNCGAPLRRSGGPVTPPPASQPPKKKSKKIGIVILIIVAALVAAFVVWKFFGDEIFGNKISGGCRNYEDAVTELFDAAFSADAEALLDLFPDDVLQREYELRGLTKEEFTDEVQDVLDELQDTLEDEASFDIRELKVDVTDAESYDEDNLEFTKTAYKRMGLKATAGKLLTVEISYEENEETFEDFGVVKIGDRWYIDTVQAIDWLTSYL